MSALNVHGLPTARHLYEECDVRNRVKFCRAGDVRCTTDLPQQPDGRLGLLGQFVPRPDSCTAANEARVAIVYSITSLARASSDDGTSMPSVLAVLRLIASSYFVGD